MKNIAEKKLVDNKTCVNWGQRLKPSKMTLVHFISKYKPDDDIMSIYNFLNR